MAEINNNDNNDLTFESLGIKSELIKALKEYGIEKPNTVQCKIIKSIINGGGNDVFIQSLTGTGKTVSIIISLLQLQSNSTGVDDIILFLTPTRELAMAIKVIVSHFALYLNNNNNSGGDGNYQVYTCIGGTQIKSDIERFKNGPPVQFILGTPGRIIDLISRKAITSLNKIKILVLEEADEIFSRGFNDHINDIVKLINDSINDDANGSSSDDNGNGFQTIVSTSTIDIDGDLSRFENKLNKSYISVYHNSSTQ